MSAGAGTATRKTSSPSAERIAALEAELAELRSSESPAVEGANFTIQVRPQDLIEFINERTNKLDAEASRYTERAAKIEGLLKENPSNQGWESLHRMYRKDAEATRFMSQFCKFVAKRIDKSQPTRIMPSELAQIVALNSHVNGNGQSSYVHDVTA